MRVFLWTVYINETELSRNKPFVGQSTFSLIPILFDHILRMNCLYFLLSMIIIDKSLMGFFFWWRESFSLPLRDGGEGGGAVGSFPLSLFVAYYRPVLLFGDSVFICKSFTRHLIYKNRW